MRWTAAAVVCSALALRLRKGGLEVHCYVNGGAGIARGAFRKRRKFRLLRQLLGIDTRVEVRSADAPTGSLFPVMRGS